ncbi:MAG: PaaI family thioesterase [Burkholderiaceae bacterium]
MSVQATNPEATGLEQLQAWLSGGKGAPIGETMNFQLAELDKGHVVFESAPGPEVYNPIGSVHGGFAATLLDSACGCAVHSMLRADQAYTTLELKVSYHRGMTTETGKVRAIGSVLTIGRRTAFAQARLVDANDKLLATATSTLLVMDRPKP